MIDFEMICAVVNFNQGSKVLRIAKHHGITDGTICLGKGTVHSRLLDLFELTDIQKEIVIMIGEKESTSLAIKALCKQMGFHTPNHGIAFSISLSNCIDCKHHDLQEYSESKVVEKAMYHAIFTVVEKGLAEDVVDAANAAGAKGGTIINARGTDTKTVFGIQVEPEKEIVLILAESGVTKAIMTSIRENLHIDEPENGLIFVTDISEVHGLY